MQQVPEEERLPLALDLLEEIGSGSFGQVWKGIWQGAPVAVKLVISSNEQQRLWSSSEIDLAQMLAHPNVVQVSCS